MTRRQTRTLFWSALLTVMLACLAFGVMRFRHVEPGVTLWQLKSGQTLTRVETLPVGLYGFGTTTMHMTTATGAPVSGGSMTRLGGFAVCRYDLSVWSYDPKSGSLTCDID